MIRLLYFTSLLYPTVDMAKLYWAHLHSTTIDSMILASMDVISFYSVMLMGEVLHLLDFGDNLSRTMQSYLHTLYY